MMKYILLLLCSVVHSLDSNQVLQEISEIISKYETQSHISNYNSHLTNSRFKRLRQNTHQTQTQPKKYIQTRKSRKPKRTYLRGSSNRDSGRYTNFVNHSGKTGFTSY